MEYLRRDGVSDGKLHRKCRRCRLFPIETARANIVGYGLTPSLLETFAPSIVKQNRRIASDASPISIISDTSDLAKKRGEEWDSFSSIVRAGEADVQMRSS